MEKKNTLFVNIMAGPNAGKTCLSLSLAGLLAFDGLDVTFCDEVAKHYVHEGSVETLKDQVLVASQQRHRLNMLKGKYDIVVTDCPAIQCLVYGKLEPEFASFIINDFKKGNNLTFFLKRDKGITFQNQGRVHTPTESITKDVELLKMLKANEINYLLAKNVNGHGIDVALKIKDAIVQRLGIQYTKPANKDLEKERSICID